MLSTLHREHRILCSKYVDDSHADPAQDCLVSKYQTFGYRSPNHLVRSEIDITLHNVSRYIIAHPAQFVLTINYNLLKPSAVYWLRFLPARRSRKIQSGIAAR